MYMCHGTITFCMLKKNEANVVTLMESNAIGAVLSNVKSGLFSADDIIFILAHQMHHYILTIKHNINKSINLLLLAVSGE